MNFDFSSSSMNFLTKLVSLTEFTRSVGSFINRLGEEKNFFLIKNNVVEAVLVDIEEYKELAMAKEILQEAEDLYLLSVAMERVDSQGVIEHEDLIKELGFTMEEIQAKLSEVD